MSNITFKRNGNIFTENTQAIVNPVNCVGVMGAGLAKAFKNTFPENYQHYRDACFNKSLKIGTVFVFNEDGRTIINLPTKNHWKDKSELNYVSDGVDAMIEAIKEHEIKSVSLPALGCGLGGLAWNTVKDLLISKLEPVEECRFVIFNPR